MAKVHMLGEVPSRTHSSFSVFTSPPNETSETVPPKPDKIPLIISGQIQQDLFSRFRRQQCSFHSFFGVQLICTLIFLSHASWNYENFPSAISTLNLIIAIIADGFSSWTVVVLKCFPKYLKRNPRVEHVVIPALEIIWLVGTCVNLALMMTITAHSGPCERDNLSYEKTTGCSDVHLPNSLPADMLVTSIMFPFILSIIVKGVRWNWVCFAFVAQFAITLVTILVYGKTQSFVTFILFSLICMHCMYENQRQSVHVFLLAQSQQHLLDENERLAAETHANELRHMIGNVAHDMKTPLSAFIGGMDILGAVCGELKAAITIKDDYITERLVTFHDTVDHIKNIHQFMLMTINRCLDYTKATQGLNLVPRMETICLRESINLPLGCMKNLQNNKISIVLRDISDQICPYVITDKQWLQENILCLLSNAAKYSVGGVVTIEAQLVDAVTLRNETNCEIRQKSGLMIRINVEDTGIGISEDNMAKLFQPFKQAQRLAGGTGLGLYSLAKRMEALDGCHGVSARPDKHHGSLFWFAIPYRPDTARADAFTANAQSEMNALGSTSQGEVSNSGVQMAVMPCNSVIPTKMKLNILVVDDSLSILKMTGMLLKRQGYTFETVENGAEALTLLSNQKQLDRETFSKQAFHVVLMDLQMPIMDGLEATRRLREVEAKLNVETFGTDVDLYAHQLIIGVSACSDHETMKAALDAGVDDFIPKPFNMTNFNETYQKMLNCKQIRTDTV